MEKVLGEKSEYQVQFHITPKKRRIKRTRTDRTCIIAEMKIATKPDSDGKDVVGKEEVPNFHTASKWTTKGYPQRKR